MSSLAELVARDRIIGTGSAALGACVASEKTGEIGIVVEVGEGRKGLWLHRPTDAPDAMVWYAVSELRLATEKDLAQIGRWILNRQRHELEDIARRAGVATFISANGNVRKTT